MKSKPSLSTTMRFTSMFDATYIMSVEIKTEKIVNRVKYKSWYRMHDPPQLKTFPFNAKSTWKKIPCSEMHLANIKCIMCE